MHVLSTWMNLRNNADGKMQVRKIQIARYYFHKVQKQAKLFFITSYIYKYILKSKTTR